MITVIVAVGLLVVLPVFVEAKRSPRDNLLIDVKNELGEAMTLLARQCRVCVHRSIRESLVELAKLVLLLSIGGVLFWIAKVLYWAAQCLLR